MLVTALRMPTSSRENFGRTPAMLIYYVYAYLRADGTPYYVGKGKDDRAYLYHGKHITVPTDRNRIVFLETNLTELGAFALERFYIRWYGRKDTGSGILRNRTDGGEGTSGVVYSEEALRKRKEAMQGYRPSEKAVLASAAARRGKKRPAEVGQKIAAGLRGKPRSEETKRKLSEANLGKVMPTKKCSVGSVVYDSVAEMATALSISPDVCYRRLRLPQYTEYRYL
jgi:hypothetical protein